MSQIPSGGPVTIPVAVDAAQAHADMARLRAEWSKPIQLNVQGPGGAGGYNGPGGGGSMAVATMHGPTTFSSQGSSMFVGPGGLGGLIGPAGAIGSNIGMGGVPYTANMGGGGQQLNHAASQLSQAVSQLSQLIGRMSNAPIVDPSPGLGALESHVAALNGPSGVAARRGAGGSGGRFMGLSTRGLSRYVGMGFLAHEALSAMQMGRQYGMETSLADGDPRALAEANLGFYHRISNIPVVGEAASLLIDPTGSREAGITRTMRESTLSDEITANRYRTGSARQSMRESANAASTFGIGRSQIEIENSYRASLRSIQQQERETVGPINALARSQSQGVVDRHTAPWPMRWNQGWNDWYEKGEQNELGQVAGEASGRSRAAHAQFDDMRADAEKIRDGAKRDFNRDVAHTRAVMRTETTVASLEAQGKYFEARSQGLTGSLQTEIEFADPQLRAGVAARTNAKRAAFDTENAFDAGSAQLSAQSAQLLEGRNARGAARNEIELWYRNASKGQSPGTVAALDAERISREFTSGRGFDERSQNFIFGLASTGRALDIQLGARNPNVGRFAARADQTFTGGLQDALQTLQRNDMSESERRQAAQLQMNNARKELQFQIRDYYAQLRPTEVPSINQVSLTGNGGGSESGKLMEQMATSMRELSTLTPDIKAILQRLNQIVPN
jgi:hypothetical protein